MLSVSWPEVSHSDRNSAQAARAFGDQHAAIRQKRRAPREFEFRHLGHLEGKARFRLQIADIRLRPHRRRHPPRLDFRPGLLTLPMSAPFPRFAPRVS